MKANSSIGIDPSSKSAHITVIPFRESWFTQTELIFEPKGKYTPARSADAFRQLITLFGKMKNDGVEPQIYLEAPTLVKGAVQAMLTQAYVSGVIQAACESIWDDSVSLIAPSQWKSHVMGKGKGNASKEMVKNFIMSSMLELDDGLKQDFYDSGALALYGLRFAD